MLTQEQLKLRKSGIGASEIGSILGVPGAFSTALQVYLDKVDDSIKPQDNNSELYYWGNALEEPIAQRYAQLNNLEFELATTIRHPHFYFLLATPDRIIKGQDIGVEIKTVGPHAISKWEDSVPLPYLLQCMQGMLVTGFKEWRLVALFCGQELKEYKIEYDDEIAHMIIQAADDFWTRHVMPRIPPPVQYHHPLALEGLKRLYPAVVESSIEVNQDIEDAIERWESNKQLANQYQKAADAEQALILDFMKENSLGELKDGRLLKRSLIKMPERKQEAYQYVKLSISKGKKK